MLKHFTLETGQKITIETPTKQSILSYVEKREAARNNKLDRKDDGDKDILDAITYPAQEEILELLEEYPLLSIDLGTAFEEIAGIGLTVERKPSLITDELKAQHGRIVGYTIDGQDLVVKKLSRNEVKFWQRELMHTKQIPYKHMSGLADSHVLQPYRDAYEQLSQKYPALCLVVGQALMNDASTKLESDEKK